MKTATLGQGRKVLELMEDIPAEQLQKLLGSGLLSDLLKANLSEVNRIAFKKVCGLISDDCFEITPAPFDPVSFIGKGWTIIPEEQDERSTKLPEVDFSKAEFIHCLEKEESSIAGEEFLSRLKKKNGIRLGSTVFMGLWQDYQANKENSVIERLYQEGRIKSYLYFFGTVLLSPGGYRNVLCLCRDGDFGGWGWRVDWLRGDWGVGGLAALL